MEKTQPFQRCNGQESRHCIRAASHYFMGYLTMFCFIGQFENMFFFHLRAVTNVSGVCSSVTVYDVNTEASVLYNTLWIYLFS